MDNYNPLVSWLMPVFNSEKTLCMAMDSMLNQTYNTFEIIVINDASNDGSQSLLEEYARKDSRIKVYSNDENLGVANTLNKGLELCQGKYIARMDADDYSYPDRLEKQVKFMEENEDVAICGTNVCRVNKKKGLRVKTNWPTDSEEIRCRLLFNIQSVHPTIMFRADYIRDNGIKYPVSPAEDYNLFATLISKVKMANLSEVLLDYYVGEDEQVTTLSFQKIRQDNLDISKRAIKDTLGVDTEKYPDYLFGSRTGNALPYYEKEMLEQAYLLFSEMIKSNKEKRIFDTVILEDQLLREWKSICGKMHLNSFKGVMQESVLRYLDSLERGNEYNKLFDYPEGRVVIYGTGDYALNYVPYMEGKTNYEIVAFCDSNPQKHNTEFFGKKIIGPDNLKDISYDYIFIASPVYFNEIRDNLIEKYYISETRIVDYRYIIDIKSVCDKEKWINEYRNNCEKPRVFIYCAPDYANLGDHAIAYAEKKFIKEKINEDIDIVEVPTRRFSEASEIADHFLTDKDLIVITGGGFLGSLWMNPESMTRKIISRYKNNKIIVLPQTLYWGGGATQQKEAEYTRSIYKEHKDLLLYARDKVSYEMMKKYYPECEVKWAPDMVLSVTWDEFIDKNVERKGALLCLKNDKESILSDSDKQQLYELCQSEFEDVISKSNMHSHIILEADEREQALKEQLLSFQSSSICITDRLHGMLFAVITETPCIVLKSCNHKLIEGYKWVEGLDYVRYADSIDEIPKLIQELKGVKGRYNSSIFSSHYDHMIYDIKHALKLI